MGWNLKKKLEFVHFHHAFVSSFQFHFLFKKLVEMFLKTKLWKLFSNIIGSKMYEN
jgi:hypothetical protein